MGGRNNMERIEQNYFSKEALDCLKKDVEKAFSGWEYIEVISYSFYQMESGLIFSETHLFANDYLHMIRLDFRESNSSWIRKGNSIFNLNERRPL